MNHVKRAMAHDCALVARAVANEIEDFCWGFDLVAVAVGELLGNIYCHVSASNQVFVAVAIVSVPISSVDRMRPHPVLSAKR